MAIVSSCVHLVCSASRNTSLRVASVIPLLRRFSKIAVVAGHCPEPNPVYKTPAVYPSEIITWSFTVVSHSQSKTDADRERHNRLSLVTS